MPANGEEVDNRDSEWYKALFYPHKMEMSESSIFKQANILVKPEDSSAKSEVKM